MKNDGGLKLTIPEQKLDIKNLEDPGMALSNILIKLFELQAQGKIPTHPLVTFMKKFDRYLSLWEIKKVAQIEQLKQNIEYSIKGENI